MKKEIWRETAVFLAATFTLTWALWFAAYLKLVPNPPFLIALGTMVPSAMGLLFTAKASGAQQLKSLLCAAVRVRAPWIWWLYAALLFPVVLSFACAVVALAGGGVPPPQFPLWFLPIAFFYIFACMGPLGEELGWRGFLLKSLLARHSLIKSGLLSGIIWSAWHLPLFLISGTVQHHLTNAMGLLAVPGYFLYTVCICMLMSALYAQTQGNLLLCMVFHTVCNLSLGAAPIILTKNGAAVLLMILLPVTVFVLKAMGKRNRKLFPQNRKENPPGT